MAIDEIEERELIELSRLQREAISRLARYWTKRAPSKD